MNQVVLLLTIGVIIVSFGLLRRKADQKYKLPPLVPGIPIFGNSFQVPPTQQGPWAKQLAEKYGEM